MAPPAERVCEISCTPDLVQSLLLAHDRWLSQKKVAQHPVEIDRDPVPSFGELQRYGSSSPLLPNATVASFGSDLPYQRCLLVEEVVVAM